MRSRKSISAGEFFCLESSACKACLSIGFVNNLIHQHRLLGHFVRGIFVLLCGSTIASFCGTAHAEENSRVAVYAAQLARSLSDKQRSVLERIPQPERRLLALRAYLKAGPNLDTRWSWTNDEIERYSRSAEYARLLEDLAAVKHAFERAHPGFTIYANTEARSLDTQIERWNSNERVGSAARNLYGAAITSLASTPAAAAQQVVHDFKRFLDTWRPSPVAPLAAPGLSLHGRMRAIDFQIMRGSEVVAATEVAAAADHWDTPGWTHKLQRAVRAAGSRFEGPLKSPHEPWHYEYRGAATSRQ